VLALWGFALIVVNDGTVMGPHVRDFKFNAPAGTLEIHFDRHQRDG
jgi:hypothetical protein